METKIDKYFQEPNKSDLVIRNIFESEKTVKEIISVFIPQWQYQTIEFCKQIDESLFEPKNRQYLLFKIWKFCKQNFQITADTNGIEVVRSPYQSWHDRHKGIDCEDFLIFISTILLNLNIPHFVRLVSYQRLNMWEHIYIIVPMGNQEVAIDALQKQYNKEVKYLNHLDLEMKVTPQLIKFNGLGKLPRPLSKDKTMKEQYLFGVQKIPYQIFNKMNGGSAIGKSESSPNYVYKNITDTIIELIEKNDLIWRKPFKQVKVDGVLQSPISYATKKNYHGVNQFLLSLHMEFIVNSNCPYYLTFNQIKSLGGSVKAGAKSMQIVFYTNSIYRNEKTNKTITAKKFEELGGTDKGEFAPSWTIQGFRVFNLEQTEGIPYEKNWEEDKPKVREQIDRCEDVIKNYPNPCKISEIYGDQAYYNRNGDYVVVPKREQFDSLPFFYSVLFHELIHSTGDKRRLDRVKGKSFGDNQYAYEELIAEMGAAFLCGRTGVEYETLKNSAAYIASWKQSVIKALKDDPKLLFKVASESTKGAEYILGELPKSIYEGFVSTETIVTRSPKTEKQESEKKPGVIVKSVDTGVVKKVNKDNNDNKTNDNRVKKVIKPGVNVLTKNGFVSIEFIKKYPISDDGYDFVFNLGRQDDKYYFVEESSGMLISKGATEKACLNVASATLKDLSGKELNQQIQDIVKQYSLK